MCGIGFDGISEVRKNGRGPNWARRTASRATVIETIAGEEIGRGNVRIAVRSAV